MATKMTGGEMISALGMGMQFFRLMTEEISNQGGRDEMIRFLTLPRFKHNLEAMVRTIVQADWRIPASEMYRISSTKHGHDVDNDFAGKFWWFVACHELGIPYDGYDDDVDGGMYPPIPTEVRRRIDGKKMEYPLFLDDRYVVIDINCTGNDNSCIEIGDVIVGRNVTHISLAERSYFDFSK